MIAVWTSRRAERHGIDVGTGRRTSRGPVRAASGVERAAAARPAVPRLRAGAVGPAAGLRRPAVDGAADDGARRPRRLHRLAGAERASPGGHVPELAHRRRLAPSPPARPAPANAATTADFAEQVVKIGIVGGLLFILVYGLFIWFAWRGRNWARIVLWVLGGLGRLSGLAGLLVGGSPLPFLTGAGRVPGAAADRRDRVPRAQAVERVVPLPGLAARDRPGADPGRSSAAGAQPGHPRAVVRASRLVTAASSAARTGAATQA